MNTSQFLAEFGTIAAAPNGVQRLREMILQLAVMGKLVPQDPADEPASVLLQRIAAEKDRLIRDGTIKRPKPLPAIRDDEKPFELPHGWEWVYLNDAYDVRDGTHDSPKYCSSGFPLITSKNLYTGKLDISNAKLISLADHQQISLRSKVDKKDILFAMIGSIGNPVIVDIDIEFSVKNVALFKYYDLKNSSPEYLLVNLKKAAIEIKNNASGGVQSFVSLGTLREYLIALPPLAEQKRIVAKVDSLMVLCDKLETLQQQRQQLDPMTQTAVLDALLPSPLAGEGLGMGGASAWQRLNQHMTTLFHTPESVKALRETILQLAVMGKLVPQDSNDEPAAVLLQHIATEKDRLIQAGKIKRQKSLSAIENSETLPELPKGWEIVNFGTYAQEVSTGPFGSMIHKSDYIQNGVPLINPSHMIEEKIVPDFSISVSLEKSEELTSYKIYQDDLVISRRGEMGRCALVDERSSGWLCGTGSFFIRFASIVDRQFILLLFKSKTIRDYLGGNSVGTTMTNLNHGILNNMPVLIPPLAEQRRIVAKVDSLMALCDKLETRLQAARETAGLFAAEAVATM